MGIVLNTYNFVPRVVLVINRRVDIELRKVVEEGKRLMRARSPDKAVAYLFKYSVPQSVIRRLLDEMRLRRR